MSGLPQLSSHQRAKLAQRLGQKTVSDDGSLTTQMAAALRVGSAPARLSAVVEALANSRLLIPVFPHATDSHENHSSLPEQLIRVEIEGTQLISTFTSVTCLEEKMKGARPVPVPIQQLAMAAAVANQPLVIDGRSDLVVPLAALSALAAGDTWVAPWDDDSLKEEVEQVIRRHQSLQAVRFMPAIDGTAMELLVDINDPTARQQIARAVQEFKNLPRIGTACGNLTVLPKPAVGV